MPRLPRSPALWYVAFVVAFLAGRAALFAFGASGDYLIYKDYSDTARETSPAELYRTREVEYPQLAVVFMVVAGTIADALPDGAEPVRAWRPDPARGDDASRYEVGLGVVLFAVDVSCLLLVLHIARRIYPHEGPFARLARLVAYTALTSAAGLIIYDRLDLVVAWFALLAVLGFLDGRPALAYAVLVAGAAYKLVPGVLLPVFALAAAAARAGPGASNGAYLRAVVREAAVAAVVLAVWPVLAYGLFGGDRAFVFLTYHSDRGLQLEAPVGWVVWVADRDGTELGHSFGSYTMRGRLSDRVAKACTLAMALACAAGALLAARGFRRATANPPARWPVRGQKPVFAALGPPLVTASLLIWMAFIVTNKVGSPQYMLWVTPLAALVPLRTWAAWAWVGVLLAACGLTTTIFPCAFGYVLGPELPDSDPRAWAGPTWWILFIFALKSATLVVVTVWLAAWVGRPAGPTAPPAPELAP